MKRGTREKIVIAVRMALGLIFLYAAFWKIRNPEAFAGAVAAYKVLPYFLNYLVAATFPWIEASCGLLLLVGYRAKAAAALAIAMNLLFIVLLSSTVVRGLDIDCGCFRQGGAKTPAWIVILRDMVFLAMATTVYRNQKEFRFSKR